MELREEEGEIAAIRLQPLSERNESGNGREREEALADGGGKQSSQKRTLSNNGIRTHETVHRCIEGYTFLALKRGSIPYPSACVSPSRSSLRSEIEQEGDRYFCLTIFPSIRTDPSDFPPSLSSLTIIFEIYIWIERDLFPLKNGSCKPGVE